MKKGNHDEVTVLGSLISERSIRNKSGTDYPVYSVTNSEGFCRGYFSKEVASEDKQNYKVVEYGDFAYNPSRINVGSIDWYRNSERGIISPLYVTFSVNEKLNKNYLKYYLKSDLSKQYIKTFATGSVRDNLKFSILAKMPITLPSIEEQKRRSSTLLHIDKQINRFEMMSNLFDDIVKSRFIEMFGLPGTDIDGKGLSKLSDFVTINPKKNTDIRLSNENLDISFIPMSGVSEKGEILATEIRKVKEVKSGFTYLQDNDVLFAKITPCMENGKGGVAQKLMNGIGFGSTEFHVLRPGNYVDPIWLYTVTSFNEFRKAAEKKMTGSAGQKRVPAKFLENYLISIPPIDEQQKFAKSKIQCDKSKFAIQESVNELEKLKKSLMQEYFG